MNTTREPLVIDTFLSLTDTLVHDFDAIDMLTMLTERSVDLLEVTAAGVILANGQHGLSVAAASTEATRLLELFAVAIDSGPCIEAVRTGETVLSGNLASPESLNRWPRYTSQALDSGFHATHAVPMRLRDDVVGVLTLLHTDRSLLDDDDLRLSRALADAATIGLLHERALRRAETLQEQLQGALTSRIIIEQAKGVLAAHGGISPEAAFAALRGHARRHGTRLTPLAREIVEQGIDPTLVLLERPDDTDHSTEP